MRIVYYATRVYSITLRTSVRRSPECVQRNARVAYVILCNCVCKVRHNEGTHGDEKPPRQSEMAGYIGGKRMYGGKERVQGRRVRSPRWRGVPPPPLAEQYFFIFEKKRKY